MAEGKIRGKKQDLLNVSHFAKCSSGQNITRKWTDRLRKRTERHQWSIVCSQGSLSNCSGSRYIKETKIYYTICTHIFYKTQITSFVFLWLNKSIKSSYVRRQVCVSLQCTHSHTHIAPTKGLESIKAFIAITFQCWKNALPLCCEMNTMLFLQG